MIVFASICPHPPIIIPEVGGENIKTAKKTIAAMEKLAEDFANAHADTIITISPHGPLFADRFNVRAVEVFGGDLAQFGAPDVQLELPSNQRLTKAIANAATGNHLPTELLASPDPSTPLRVAPSSSRGELDHGIIVPLHFLLKNLSYSPTLIPIGFSNLPLKDHYQFGTMIARVCQDKLNRIAVIASGDLSHRLTTEAPAGFSPRGREFDEKLIEFLGANDVRGIINLDPKLTEEAGECGLRPIVILLGAIRLWRIQPLSYENPFGVGYLVARVRKV